MKLHACWVKVPPLMLAAMLSAFTAVADERPSRDEATDVHDMSGAAAVAPTMLDLRVPPQPRFMGFDLDPRVDLREADLETVEIRAFRPREPATPDMRVPYVTGGLGAMFWAAMNPAQAWRILLPDPIPVTDERFDSR